MTQRMMVFIDLNKWGKFTAANVLDPVAALLERTSGWQVSYVRRKAGDLIEFSSLFVCGVRNTLQ